MSSPSLPPSPRGKSYSHESPWWVGCWLSLLPPWDRTIRTLFIPARRQLDYCPSIKTCLLYQMRAACELVNCSWAPMAWLGFMPPVKGSPSNVLASRETQRPQLHSIGWKVPPLSGSTLVLQQQLALNLLRTLAICLIHSWGYLCSQTRNTVVTKSSWNIYTSLLSPWISFLLREETNLSTLKRMVFVFLLRTRNIYRMES